MKEIREIIYAYDELLVLGKKSALATVVQVDGSSYRRPGARMLISEDGRLTGAISGGCLEGDALRKALFAINQQQVSLVTYDTNDETDGSTEVGLGLGCNGVIQVLIEPIIDADELNPIALLKLTQETRQASVLITTFSPENKQQISHGTKLYLGADGKKMGDWKEHSDSNAEKNVSKVLATGCNLWENPVIDDMQYTIFYEYIKPNIRLVIAGAGNDVKPLVAMAELLGWETTIVDGRANYASKSRFPSGCQVLVSKPEQVLQYIEVDTNTVFALMTHNFYYDKALLGELIQRQTPYIAILGPKSKSERMIRELRLEGKMMDKEYENIFSPAGLDLGSETADEIALSIIAEIVAIMKGIPTQSLKYKKTPIHGSDQRP